MTWRQFFDFKTLIVATRRPKFVRYGNLNHFPNFYARDLVDHLNERPGSPLSYFYHIIGVSSVGQKLGRGRKFFKMWKSPKSVAKMARKIAKNELVKFLFSFYQYLYSSLCCDEIWWGINHFLVFLSDFKWTVNFWKTFSYNFCKKSPISPCFEKTLVEKPLISQNFPLIA